MNNSATNKVKQARHCDHNLKFLRILLCVVIGVLSLVLCVTVGYTQRTPNFNLTSSSKLATTSRIITLGVDLINVDDNVGTMTLQWSIDDDSACDPSNMPPCPNLSQNSTVDIFQVNILRPNVSTSAIVPSDNQPDTPIFRHNATALYAPNVYDAWPTFRTPLVLFPMQNGRAVLSTAQWYPFDEYITQILVFALDSETRQPLGLQIGRADGISLGYQAFATPSPKPLRKIYPGAISELVTISRSSSVKAYTVIIVILVWLMTIMFLSIVVSILCGVGLNISLLLVPVGTLIAFPQLRGTMPGSPVRFGAVIDFVGFLPCLALILLSVRLHTNVPLTNGVPPSSFLTGNICDWISGLLFSC